MKNTKKIDVQYDSWILENLADFLAHQKNENCSDCKIIFFYLRFRSHSINLYFNF